jgi:hypothetical protein
MTIDELRDELSKLLARRLRLISINGKCATSSIFRSKA